MQANSTRTAINLLVAFSKSVMHRLRFEPYMDYDDMRGYVAYLSTYSREANVGVDTSGHKHGPIKRLGEILGVSFCEENPRKMVKQAQKPTGNLPLEILGYIQAYFDSAFENKNLSVAVYQQQSSMLIFEKVESGIGLIVCSYWCQYIERHLDRDRPYRKYPTAYRLQHHHSSNLLGLHHGFTFPAYE